MADIIYLIKYKRSRLAYLNIKCAYDGELDSSGIKKIVRGVYRNLMRNFFELLRFPAIDEKYLKRYTDIRGFGYTDEALKKGKGAIFLTAHFGNWELASAVVPLLGYRLKVLAREQGMPRLNGLLNKYRGSTGADIVYKGISTKMLFKALKENETVGMLVDQDGGKQGYFVEFFGRLASTHPGVISISLRTGCTVLPGFMTRLPGGRHMVEVEPPLNIHSSGDEKSDISRSLQDFASILERHIRRAPDQWLWLHKRWKSSPSRKVLILSDGKAGHDNQSSAVAAAVRKAVKEKYSYIGRDLHKAVLVDKITVEYKNALLKKVFGAARYMVLGRTRILRLFAKACLKKDVYEKLYRRYADIVISCGSSLGSINRMAAEENNAKSFSIMRLPFFDARDMDMAVIPRHDNVRPAKNVVIIDGALANTDKDISRKEACDITGKLGLDGRPKLGLLLGGDSRRHIFREGTVERVLDAISKAADTLDADIFITTSRRTPARAEDLVQRKMGANPRCKMLVIANRENLPGVVSSILGLADVVVVSGESVSMVSEAVASGKSVVAFTVPERRGIWTKIFKRKSKHAVMLSLLKERGRLKVAGEDDMGSLIAEAAGEKREDLLSDNDRAVMEFLKGLNI